MGVEKPENAKDAFQLLRAAIRVLERAVQEQAEMIEHHVEELDIRMDDITRLTRERDELRAWVADMERRERERSK